MPRTRNIILLIDPSGEYDRGMLRGIAKYSRLHGNWSFYGSFGIPKEEIEIRRDLQADGVLARHLEDIEPALKGLPTVVCTSGKKDVSGISCIDIDNEQVGKTAAEHFKARGFRLFAFCGRHDKYWSYERGQHFCEEVIDAGFEAYTYNEPKKIINSSWNIRQKHLGEWIKSLPKPIGVFACNDNRAQHIIEACRRTNTKVPEEVAVLGVDDDELICNLSRPPISSVQLNFERAGYEAAQHLENLIEGNAHDRIIVVRPVGVRARQSTDIFAVKDPDVAEGLKFIRDNLAQSIGVTDVYHHVGLSRRAIELKFKRNLGVSINAQIRKMRVQKACDLLVETNLPIKNIAVELGYPDTTHIARYFKKEKGLSLKAYRELYGSH